MMPTRTEVLATHRRSLGDDHQETLRAVNNLAVFYNEQGRYAEAEPLHRTALEGRRSIGATRSAGTRAGCSPTQT